MHPLLVVLPKDASEKTTKLLDYLLVSLSKYQSRTEIKRLLKFGRIRVSGAVQTQHDTPLKNGDRIEILGAPKGGKTALDIFSEPPAIRLVHEDHTVLVVDKPAGLLAVATEKIKNKTLYYRLNEYLKLKRERIFIVHRLDREASGLMVFAKNEEAKHKLQDEWDRTDKKYYAVVEGVPSPRSGEIKSFLSETKALKVYSSKESDGSKLAITRYKVLKNNRRSSLLEVTIPTGRKHQIRVHLSDLNHPILGDEKYGSSSDPLRRLGLHACYLEFTHPLTKKRMRFETELPKEFLKIAR